MAEEETAAEVESDEAKQPAEKVMFDKSPVPDTVGDDDVSAVDDSDTDSKDSNKSDESNSEDKTKPPKVDDAVEMFGKPEDGYDLSALKAPEGVDLDKNALDKFAPVAEELNLSQDGLQRVSDLYAEIVKDAAEVQTKNLIEMEDGWMSTINEDSELGGDDRDAKLKNVARATEKFGTDAFKEMLNTTRYGNHPEMVRFLKRVGDALDEDGVVTSKSAGRGQQTLEEVLYPTKTN